MLDWRWLIHEFSPAPNIVRYARFSRWNVFTNITLSVYPPPALCLLLCNICRLFREFARICVWFIHGKCFHCSHRPGTVTVFPGKKHFLRRTHYTCGWGIAVAADNSTSVPSVLYSECRIVKLPSQFVEIVRTIHGKRCGDDRRNEIWAKIRIGRFLSPESSSPFAACRTMSHQKVLQYWSHRYGVVFFDLLFFSPRIHLSILT